MKNIIITYKNILHFYYLNSNNWIKKHRKLYVSFSRETHKSLIYHGDVMAWWIGLKLRCSEVGVHIYSSNSVANILSDLIKKTLI